MDNAPQEDLELKALSQALHQLYDPVLEEPLPGRLRARRRRWRAPAIAAGWVILGLCAGTIAGWQLHASRPASAPQARYQFDDALGVVHTD